MTDGGKNSPEIQYFFDHAPELDGCVVVCDGAWRFGGAVAKGLGTFPAATVLNLSTVPVYLYIGGRP